MTTMTGHFAVESVSFVIFLITLSVTTGSFVASPTPRLSARHVHYPHTCCALRETDSLITVRRTQCSADCTRFTLGKSISADLKLSIFVSFVIAHFTRSCYTPCLAKFFVRLRTDIVQRSTRVLTES